MIMRRHTNMFEVYDVVRMYNRDNIFSLAGDKEKLL